MLHILRQIAKTGIRTEPAPAPADDAVLAARLQEQILRTLGRALTNPAWARRLAGARPEDLTYVDDWRRLPFLTKDELRDAYPFGLACGGAEGYRRVHMSSGTTGNPILNPYTEADVSQWAEVMARSRPRQPRTATSAISPR